MITRIDITNFKPFLSTTCELRPLTYILGENGIGKSSITQSILLLKQSLALSSELENLALNGSYARIGNGVDALCQLADVETIAFGLTFTGGETVEIAADYLSDSDVLPAHVADSGGLALIEGMHVDYLSANRVGPQLLSQFSRSGAVSRSIDEKGINALALLYEYGDSLLPEGDARVPEASASRSMSQLFDHYISQISSGASIALSGLTNIDSVSSTYSFAREGALPLSNIRPTNVGFGLSYVASVIVACLLAQPGSLLIFENPEAHLHTKGQRAIANLFARSAMAGIQIVCETHSREMLYYTRKEVSEKRIDSNLVSVAYVSNNEGERRTDQWFPLTKRFSELPSSFESFLEYFGAPTDFII